MQPSGSCNRLGRRISTEVIAEDGAEHLQQLFTSFPDVHTTVLNMFGEGDKIVARLRINDTNNGPGR